MKKKIISVLLTATMVLGLVACGDNSTTETKTETNEPTETTSEETTETEEVVVEEGYEYPDSITVMFDGTVFTEANGRDEFETALEAVMSDYAGKAINIDIIQPDHAGYYDSISQTFAGDASTWPDVVLLGAQFYSSYASQGVLSDVTNWWETSELKDSGRVVSETLIDALYIDDVLYGISPARGNGCATYVKQAWLDAAGITTVPTNYEEYTAMLQAFVDAGLGEYALSSAGIMNAEAPYVNYLPEFFQDAYPDFYQKDDGTWVDGFTEDSMTAALDRLIEAYDSGWLDPECITNDTKAVREKYFADKCGVFTYWAGTWRYTLESTLESKSEEDLPISFGNTSLVAMEPIAEIDKYIERQATVWGVTTACEDSDAVADLFFSTMLDGADGQILWEYGVENVHWSTAAETLVTNAGTDSEKENVFEEGTFHGKVNIETGATLYSKNHIDKLLAVASLIQDFGSAIDPRAEETMEMFNQNSKIAPVIVSNDVMSKYNSEILSTKQQLITQVVTGELSVDDAMAKYNDQYGSQVEEILASLN